MKITCINKNDNFVKETDTLAILLYEQFIHLTQVNLHPNIQFLSTQQYAITIFFWLLPGLIPFASL